MLNEAFENIFSFKKFQPDYKIIEHVFAVSHMISKANILAIAVERREVQQSETFLKQRGCWKNWFDKNFVSKKYFLRYQD